MGKTGVADGGGRVIVRHVRCWPVTWNEARLINGRQLLFGLTHTFLCNERLSTSPSPRTIAMPKSLTPGSKDDLGGDHVVFQGKLPPGMLSLPSTEEVRRAALLSGNPSATNRPRPPPVKFPSLRLLVKYGTQVSVAEAHCLIFIRTHLPNIPVPEVYGWCHDGGQNFIYMELIEGSTLEERWNDLNEEERTNICQELRTMVESWRALPQDLTAGRSSLVAPFIGKFVMPLSV